MELQNDRAPIPSRIELPTQVKLGKFTLEGDFVFVGRDQVVYLFSIKNNPDKIYALYNTELHKVMRVLRSPSTVLTSAPTSRRWCACPTTALSTCLTSRTRCAHFEPPKRSSSSCPSSGSTTPSPKKSTTTLSTSLSKWNLPNHLTDCLPRVTPSPTSKPIRTIRIFRLYRLSSSCLNTKRIPTVP